MPRHHERKTYRGLVSPIWMLRAAREVKNNRKSIRSVSKDFGINYRTLTRYCKKFTSEEINDTSVSTPSTKIGYKKNRQIFTDEQEELLEQYIVCASNIYFELASKHVRKIAFEFVISHNLKAPQSWESNKLAGVDWFAAFMKRHPLISLRTPEAINLDQHNDTSFFKNLDSVIKQYNFQPQDIWNMDETAVNAMQKPKELGDRKEPKEEPADSSAEKGSLIILAATFSGDGNSIPPFFVCRREHLKDKLIKDGLVGCKGGNNPSIAMTEQRFVVFLKHFHKHVKSTKEKPCLLLLENHSSRISVEGLKFAKENGIIMLSFPPDCAHHLQLLDGPLKKFINQAMEQWMENHQNFLQEQDFLQPFDTDKESTLIKYPDGGSVQNLAGNESDKREFHSCTLFVDQITDPDELAMAQSDTSDLDDLLSVETDSPGLDDSLLIQNDNSKRQLNVRATAPQDSTSSPMPELILLHQATKESVTMSTPGPSGSRTSLMESPQVLELLSKILPHKLQRTDKRKCKSENQADSPEDTYSEVEKTEQEAKKKKVSKREVSENKEKKKMFKGKKIKEEVVDNDGDDEELICLVCLSQFSSNPSRDAWIQCQDCKLWAHDACTPVLSNYICHHCGS